MKIINVACWSAGILFAGCLCVMPLVSAGAGSGERLPEIIRRIG